MAQLKIGIHTGPQNVSMEELLALWRRADEAGFHWISVWDHFYANPLQSRQDPCFEGVASMATLAAVTERVRVGCLVFCALFRNPALLAKAATTIDHVSGGRAELGLGAGWFEEEFHDFGYDFPPLGERLDQLEEALEVTRSLLRDEETNFEGRYYELSGAVCSPKPVGDVRLWVGGRGRKRTPALAARFADGFNMPYLSPEDAAERLDTLHAECEQSDRDVAEIETSVNVGYYLGRAGASGPPEHLAGGALVGSSQQAIDHLGAYVDAGLDGVNLAFRPPIDRDDFERFIDDVLPVFHDDEEPGVK
ncbi:MAG: TIGR03560 family F420-dependent LLM class oxidoreductase [Acidobacteriota bacterium]